MGVVAPLGTNNNVGDVLAVVVSCDDGVTLDRQRSNGGDIVDKGA